MRLLEHEQVLNFQTSTNFSSTVCVNLLIGLQLYHYHIPVKAHFWMRKSRSSLDFLNLDMNLCSRSNQIVLFVALFRYILGCDVGIGSKLLPLPYNSIFTNLYLMKQFGISRFKLFGFFFEDVCGFGFSLSLIKILNDLFYNLIIRVKRHNNFSR